MEKTTDATFQPPLEAAVEQGAAEETRRIGRQGHNEYVAKVEAKIASLRKSKKKMPAERTGGPVSVVKFAELAGIPVNAARGARIAGMIRIAERKLGTAAYVRPAPSAPSLAAVAKQAVALKRSRNRREGFGRNKDVPALRAVLTVAARISKRGSRADATEALASVDDNKLSAAQKRELAFAKETARELADNGGLPRDFTGRLRVCLAEGGMTATDLNREIGAYKGLVRTWLGGVMPSISSIPLVERMEQVLGRRAGTLTDYVRSTRPGAGGIPIGMYPKDLRGPESSDLRIEMAHGLPHTAEFALMHEDDRERLMNEARRVCEPIVAYSRLSAKLAAQPYKYREWNPRFAAQWNELVLHMTGFVAHFAFRSDRVWKETTCRLMRELMSGVAGSAVGEAAGAMRLDPATVDVASIVGNPALVQHHVDELCRRRAEAGGRAQASRLDAGLFGQFARWFRRKGWARQSLLVRASLGYADRPDADWIAHCDYLADDYADRAADARSKAGYAVPKHINTREVLLLKDPMSVVKKMVAHLAPRWRDPEVGVRERAVALQMLVHIQLQAQVAFRPCTTMRLEWSANGIGGHLRKDDRGRWHLDVPAEIFKNPTTPRLAHGYQRTLIDQWGFYEQLEAFLKTGGGRETLLDGVDVQSQYLFFFGDASISAAKTRTSRQGKLLAVCVKAVSSATVTASIGFLREAKIPQARRLTPVDFRDILATSIMKRTKSVTRGLTLAADALADQEETVEKYYVQYLPSERAAELVRLLRGHRGPVVRR